MVNSRAAAPVIRNPYLIPNDIAFLLGNDGDFVIFLRSATLTANTTLAVGGRDIIVGTPVVPALPANTAILSNITASGDIVILGNRGGNSEEYLRVDASAGELFLNAPLSSGFIRFSAGGIIEALLGSDGMRASAGNGGILVNETSSATNPTLAPNQSDLDTGIGRGAADQLSMIAGGVEGIRVSEASGVIDVTLTGAVNYGAPVSLTIASGAVAVTATLHTIVVEGGAGAGADILATATGGVDGQVLILKPTTSGANDQVTVADGTGSDTFILAGNADFVMDHLDDRLTLLHNGTEWVETARSGNS